MDAGNRYDAAHMTTDRPFQPPRPERVEIPGPAGPLEAIVDDPKAEAPQSASSGPAVAAFGVVCHPNPIQGGTMTNKVVHTVARAFNELGVPTVRFNFRGVGKSAGRFDEGRGETDDALAAIAYGRKRWPGAGLWLAGFSFGGAIAVRVAGSTAPALLVTISPAVMRLSVSGHVVPRCPWLVVQGDADDVVEPQAILDWTSDLDPAPAVKMVAGAGHFFHGRLTELRDIVTGFAREHSR